MRAAAYAITIVCALGAPAIADAVGKDIAALSSSESSDKLRLSAALALGKTKDPRAIIALADALGHDDDASVRRVAALGLGKMLDAKTPDDARVLALQALDKAAAHDGDKNVKQTAANAARALSSLRKTRAAPRGDRPEVLVNIETTTDQSKRAPSGVTDKLTAAVKKKFERRGYATAWPGGKPTSSELAAASSQAFIVAPTVQKIDITKNGRRSQIMCTLAIRIAPWSGSDGGEKWEAQRAASATGSAKATAGSSDRDISGGVRECLEAVSDDLVDHRILPFLKRLVVASAP